MEWSTGQGGKGDLDYHVMPSEHTGSCGLDVWNGEKGFQSYRKLTSKKEAYSIR